jgi:hypothetical protein
MLQGSKIQGKGRVRSAIPREVIIGKREGRKGSRSTAFFSSPLHNKIRFSPFLLCYKARGWFLCLWRVWWRWGNRMGVKEEAKRGCGLISGGMVVYVGLGKVGPKEVLWLVG